MHHKVLCLCVIVPYLLIVMNPACFRLEASVIWWISVMPCGGKWPLDIVTSKENLSVPGFDLVLVW